MGKALAAAYPAARQVFEEVVEVLGQSLSRLMFEGPENTLMLTENAQPALMAAGMAVVRALEAEAGFRIAEAAAFVAGHSLGEYTALAAAGALDLGTTASLLRTRGQAMQRAVPNGEGAMAAVLGLDLDRVEWIAASAADSEVCDVANDNAPGQVVLSGHATAVDRAVAMAGNQGARAVMLAVSAPFHCNLMAPAAKTMAEALAAVEIRRPRPAIFANVTAAPTRDPRVIRDLLVEQVTARVRWRESVVAMREAGVDSLVELGPQRVLTGLARRIDRTLDARAVGTPEEIGALVDIMCRDAAA